MISDAREQIPLITHKWLLSGASSPMEGNKWSGVTHFYVTD